MEIKINTRNKRLFSSSGGARIFWENVLVDECLSFDELVEQFVWKN
jgi:hypothetical protein